jgi:hypothetical protein
MKVMTNRNLYTISGFSEKHQAFSPASLRNLRFYQNENGFSDAFLTLGRKVLIDEEMFFQCLDRINCRESSV